MIDAIMPMARRFHDAGKPNWPWREDDVRATIEGLIASPTGYVAANENGFFLGTMSPNPFARDWMIAAELFWWSEDGNGLKLALGFRKWAKRNGASEIYWSCPVGAKANRLFSRFGRHTENNYSEILQCV